MLITYLLKVSLLFAVLTLGYRWLIQYETFSKVNRILLWLNVLAAWSLPLTPLPDWGPVEVQQEFHHQIPRIIESMPILPKEIITGRSAIIFSSNPEHTNWANVNLIFVIYLLGVVFLSARLILPLVKIFYALWRSPSEKLDNGIILIRNQNTLSPYSFFQWIICNPENHSPKEFEHILAHESEHILQHHSLDLLLAEVQKIILWFNPFAWFHQKIVQENLEYLADRAVLESGFQKKHYQLSLLKTVMQNHELPLTNSFAQSLLKKRIKMMNRTPSGFWVTGKYLSLIALLYLSCAFVSPYSKNVTALIPTLANPALPELFTKNENHTAQTAELRTESKESKKDGSRDEPSKVKRSKWVVEKGGTLYWAISALATWDDINEIKQEVKKFGGELDINSIEYDPFQFFITTLVVNVKLKGAKGSANEKEDRYTPMKGVSGYIAKGSQLGMGQTPPEPLNTIIQKDYEKALLFEKTNKAKYFEDRITTKLKDKNQAYSGRNFSSKDLKSKDSELLLKTVGIEKAFDNTLTITESNKFANFYLNASNSKLSELNTLSFDEIENISIVDDHQGQRYIFVRTK